MASIKDTTSTQVTDPKTGIVTAAEFYSDASTSTGDGGEKIKAAQAQLTCIPFNAPYLMMVNVSSQQDVAYKIAQEYGLSYESVLKDYLPYNQIWPSNWEGITDSAAQAPPIVTVELIQQIHQALQEIPPVVTAAMLQEAPSNSTAVMLQTIQALQEAPPVISAAMLQEYEAPSNGTAAVLQAVQALQKAPPVVTAAMLQKAPSNSTAAMLQAMQALQEAPPVISAVMLQEAPSTISADEGTNFGQLKKKTNDHDAIRTAAFSIFSDSRMAYALKAAGQIGTIELKKRLSKKVNIFHEDKVFPAGHSSKKGYIFDEKIKVIGHKGVPSIKALWDFLVGGTGGQYEVGTGEDHPLEKPTYTYQIGPGLTGLAAPNFSFRDATFTINKPFVEVAYQSALGEEIGLSDPVKVSGEYNFYSSLIEKANPFPEIVLPNLYGILHDMEKPIPKYSDQWDYPIEGNLSAISALQPPNPQEYLDKFAIQLNSTKAVSPQIYSNILKTSDKYKTTGISANHMKNFMADADKAKKLFPMYVDVEIPVSNTGKVGATLHKAGLADQFMQLVMGALYTGPAGNKEAQKYYTQTAIVKKDSFIKKDSESGMSLSLREDNLYYDPLIKLWLNDILQSTPMLDLDTGANSVSSDFVESADHLEYIKKFNKDIAEPFLKPVVFGKKKGGKFINNIKWLVARKKILNLVKEKVRNVNDIYNGKEAYSEVLFYEVAKYRTKLSDPEAGGVFVQNVFLPNIPNMNVLKYVDTQVKFGHEYYYQVYAHTFVIGTQYQMDDAEWFETDPQGVSESPGPLPGNQPDSYSFEFNYTFKPSVYLMRVPFYNTHVTMNKAITFGGIKVISEEGTPKAVADQQLNPQNLELTPIVDKPPVFPDAVFLPLYGEKNKILLNTNFNVGEEELVPVFIDENETPNLEKIRRNQKKLTGPITFSGDDFCGKIEILRIDKKPTSYADFAPSANTRIATAGGTAAFGYIDDTLTPNKDYYYVVRAQDVHGSYSNPSPIYQVRIVLREGEAPYAIFRMLFVEELKKEIDNIKTKFMKYIRIQPSIQQSFINDKNLVEKYDSVEEIKPIVLQENIGDPELSKTIFGQNFKFRFTSKKTGRKFDLNLTIEKPAAAPATNKVSQGAQDGYSAGKC